MTDSAAPAIEVQDVCKFYLSADGRKTLALDRVNLTVKRGEFVSIIGPSGCGKTTLLKMVAGILGWDEGRISVLGAPVTGPGAERATVFQSFALLPWMTVLDNAAFGLKMRGEAKVARRRTAQTLLDKVGLGDFASAYPGELSGGMQQRVGLARALAVSPDILLMDEPFSAIDAQTRLILQTELLNIWSGSDLSVLFITHAMDEAVFLSDRVVIMGARPGHVTDIIEIDLPRPRTEETRKEPRFVELTAMVWDRLRGMIADEHTGEAA
ncbi:ABC transporter ATP-binding protein [Nitratireductor thuwali]|uniref:Bicarbonate transport ATP-binding protein CmpD n=1 Tax=Nitratireductor thuwali TaxID=2267699 RepID=A0ABY5MFA6_9HYPH|nr:Bicarbonate transport ATP-binding protein CmpD [Nitratireductor thuwali]